jgi:hypothetical protein
LFSATAKRAEVHCVNGNLNLTHLCAETGNLELTHLRFSSALVGFGSQRWNLVRDRSILLKEAIKDWTSSADGDLGLTGLAGREHFCVHYQLAQISQSTAIVAPH